MFKGKSVQRTGVTKRLLLKLFSLIAIKRLTSALKQTEIARHSIFKLNLMSPILTIVVITFLNVNYDRLIRHNLERSVCFRIYIERQQAQSINISKHPL